MATATSSERVLHAEPDEQSQLADLVGLIEHLETQGTPKTRLLGPNGETIDLPASAYEALKAVAGAMAQGLTITLVPHGKQLTTQQAADLLHVSRPSLVKLVEDGKIAFHKVGTHRRLKIEDVLRYRAERAEERRKALQELTELSEDIGYR
jgi:excisionase family DNA binding protein